MADTATTATPSSPKIDWEQIMPILQIASNGALAVLGATGVVPAFIGPLVSSIWTSVNPLVAAVQSGAATSTDVLAGYGALIGTLGAIQKNTSLDQATLNKISSYTQAAQDATIAYVKAGMGFDPSTLTPVTPIT